MFLPASEKLDAVQSPEMLLNVYQTTRHYTPKTGVHNSAMRN
jgi:hypothetical protein